MNGKPIIALQDICFAYPGRSPILRDLALTLYEGEHIGLIAPNGSGKTTLFHLLVGLLKPSAGKIVMFDRPVVTEKDFIAVRRQVGLLFQDADDQLFSPTVIEDIAFGPLNLGKSQAEALAISRSMLSFLGLEGFEKRVTIKLSGGEKRLVALATILAMEPRMLLLDEPSAGLDNATKRRLIDILRELKISYMIVSHELDFLSQVVDKVYLLHEGQIQTEINNRLHEHLHLHACDNRFGWHG
ncbi:MAG: ABC transporter ATP-binding protein [Deltaproteobacteria bacterium]|nr:ABC transporter ATP-binding protein [Deltaproteobacteria bacterium]